MPGYDVIVATGRSLVRLLNHCFSEVGESEDEPHSVLRGATATLMRSEDFATAVRNDDTVPGSRGVSIFFYRVDVDRVMRPPLTAVGNYEGRAQLPLILHFLLTPWAENAEYELLLLGRAMQCIEINPILTGPLLDPLGSWDAGDAIQLSTAEITTEEVMRTFDSLAVDFKLSVPYVARGVRMAAPRAWPRPPVERALTGLRPGADPSTSPLPGADAYKPDFGEDQG